MKKINVKLVISIIISMIGLYFAFKGVDWHVIVKTIGRIKARYLVGIGLLYVGGYLIRSVRWHFLLIGVKNISPVKLFPHLMIGFFINNILPMRIGEFARAYTSGKKLGISKSASFGSIVLERTFDGLCFIILVIISFSFMPFSQGLKKGVIIAVIFFIAMLFVLYFFTNNEDKSKTIIKKLPLSEKIKSRISELFLNFSGGLRSLRSFKTMIIIMILSMIVWGIELIGFYLMSKAFGLDISLIHIIFTAMCVVLGVMIPAAPGYIGTFEYAGKTGLKLSGIDPSVGLAFILFVHFVQFVIVALMGLPAFLMQHITLKEIKQKN